MVIDELAMTPGQLNEKGVANLTALGGVVQWQKVKYDFKFHSQDFNCDLVCYECLINSLYFFNSLSLSCQKENQYLM